MQYFWKLLNGLSIQYVTLLDLDTGRKGGAWGRIKTALERLIESTIKGKALGGSRWMPGGPSQYAHVDRQQERPRMGDLFTGYGVYFSDPLDLDMAMLKAFPKAYEAFIPKGGGPSGKKETAVEAVLGDGGEGLKPYAAHYPGYGELMPAYRYHFLTHSKPATHLRAFAHLDDAALKKDMPKLAHYSSMSSII